MDPVEVREERVATTDAPGEPVAYRRAGITAERTTVAPVGYRLRQLVWLAVGIVDILLALDFVFRLGGANDTGFASFIYGAGSALSSPFRGIFGSTTATNGAHVAVWADILAIVVYTIAAWIVDRIIAITATPRNRGMVP